MSILLAPFRLLASPVRLYRRHISVQLITSHVLVVLLTALAIELVAIFVFAIGLPIFISDSYTDFSTVDVARSVVISLQTDPAASQLASGATAVTAEQRRTLRKHIDGFIGSPPGNGSALVIGGIVDGVAITDPAGRVVVVSDPAWIGPSHGGTTPVTILADQLIARIVELNGQRNAYGELYVIDSVDMVTVVAYPVIRDGEMAGVVAVRSTMIGPPSLFALANRPDIVLGLLVANTIVFVLILIPALVVAIPVGIWRARVVSRRIAHLTDAATAMAAGDRAARVTVRGKDEVAQLGEQFNVMLDHLDRADRERKAFVANVSHDLRTPIAIIQGHVEQILDAPTEQATPELRDALDVIHQETATLSRLIDDLFTVARLEETSLPMHPEPVNAGAIAGEVAGAIQPVAWDQRRVSVRSIVPGTLPPALADPVRVRQILNNLVYNALRHTPEGGLVVIDGAEAGDAIELQVSDTGIGMTDEERQHVFERFYQIEQGRRVHDGGGLGLAIVKELAEAQGGSVAVESAPGQGTTFRVRLPRYGPRESAPA